jgi:hypothetical protein
MSWENTGSNRSPDLRYEVRTRVRALVVLVAIAAGLGLVILAAAAIVPVVTVQSAPTSAVAPAAGLPAVAPSTSLPSATAAAAPVFTTAPRVTLLTHFGASALGIAAIPLVAAIVVGLLLHRGILADSRNARAGAWSLSAVLTTAGVVGFVTILIGVVVVPVGILLMVACGQSAPHGVVPSGEHQGPG